MSLSYEDEQYAYHLTYTTVRLYGNHDQAHRWACYARDSWEIANALKRGYSKGKEFLRVARFNCHEEDVYKVLVREGIEPPPNPVIQRYDHHCPGCPHTAPHGHGHIPPDLLMVHIVLLMVLKFKIWENMMKILERN